VPSLGVLFTAPLFSQSFLPSAKRKFNFHFDPLVICSFGTFLPELPRKIEVWPPRRAFLSPERHFSFRSNLG